ncbi:Uncharacterised protein [Chlamydia abortus]|nr:Uncharacterised protein [Chlamydia abortus]
MDGVGARVPGTGFPSQAPLLEGKAGVTEGFSTLMRGAGWKGDSTSHLPTAHTPGTAPASASISRVVPATCALLTSC